MPGHGRILAVFCYDVARDYPRRKLADLLGEYSARVQDSVFEGWMTRAQAARLAKRAAGLLGPDDLFRVYHLESRAALRTAVYGPAPPVELHDFHLL